MFGRVEQAEFEAYKSLIEQRFSELYAQLNRHPSQSEEEARAAADSASQSKQRADESAAEIARVLQEANSYREGMRSELEIHTNRRAELEAVHRQLNDELTQTRSVYLEAVNRQAEIHQLYSSITGEVAEIRQYVDMSRALPQNLEVVKQSLEEITRLRENVNGIVSHSLHKKTEIDAVYDRIFGQDVINESGGTEHLDGLKDYLDSSYDEVLRNLNDLNARVGESLNSINSIHKKELASIRASAKEKLERYEKRAIEVNEELVGLLPGSLAAGLSAAYEQKKNDEIDALNRYDTSFKLSIFGMLLVSSIPFGVDAYLLGTTSRQLLDIVKDTPMLIAAVLPLYFPILWFAFSANKKSNLSKRLIEEYTHKAVLGKTFSGLSNQIDGIQNNDSIKEQMRTQLLFNVLQVSSENPGKLITNYNKSDHPLMEALENSVKLTDSVSALAKIPGFSALANKLATKADELLKVQESKVRTGLSTCDVMNAENSSRQKDETAENRSI